MTKLTPKKIIIIVIGGIILLGVGAVLVTWLTLGGSKSSTTDTSGTSDIEVPAAENQALLDEVNKKIGSKDYKEAIELIENNEDADSTANQKLLASVYINSGNIKKGYEIYKNIDDTGGLSAGEIGHLGDVAAQAGDYKAAIEYYKKAKQALTNTANAEEAATYDYKIKEAEKKL